MQYKPASRDTYRKTVTGRDCQSEVSLRHFLISVLPFRVRVVPGVDYLCPKVFVINVATVQYDRLGAILPAPDPSLGRSMNSHGSEFFPIGKDASRRYTGDVAIGTRR